MSSNVPINPVTGITAPTPQNTPLTHAPISGGLSRPTVPDISEDPEVDEDGAGAGGEDDEDDDDEEEDVHESVVVGDPNQGSSLSDAQKLMLTGLVQAKLSRLIGKSSGYIESLPVPVKKNVEALKGVQVKRTALQNQFKREILELERKVCVLVFFLLVWNLGGNWWILFFFIVFIVSRAIAAALRPTNRDYQRSISRY